ncbi:right-handed parallel beta-helix repeat-containing protein [Phytohabitans sp. ZYX-F-186]|uniref:Right-handed parallel beta-helix repeat-containing protein n=1 Tax=Phytohabitans maris TaxID=3071409 RepID=A0ABU0ZN94_9ACTN|nr:right-handed parallel beta-helix repeat-containing protein [Phytohabitans sp. ZYX-F-186]MDQ7908470.1 right-handed parallel beta-helix repeat-containing protein [Phytohabitans sp. ZYX-F-186]
MSALSRALLVGAGAVAGAALAVTVTLAATGGSDEPTAGEWTSVEPAPPTTGAPATSAPTQAVAPPVDGLVTCPPATVTVTDAQSLGAALGQAKPGDSIHLADGVYEEKFVASTPGTADQPIFLCGGSGAVIDAGGVKGGYGFHLKGASHWRLVGFTVRNAQKGVMADQVQGAVIQQLTVEQIGDEGIHLRNFSTDNLVQANTVRDTGHRRDTFGEGIYVGTAESNWCEISNCKPDNSDRNVVRGNTISDTTAEAVDIKEGTTGGKLLDNTFDGARLSGSHNDSWVDVKGNGWLIQGNTGRNSREDGFQTHEVVDGWGANNIFKANVAEVNGPGFGFNFTPVNGNTLGCDNKATGAAKGLANIDCA